MVDVGDKPESKRTAIAQGEVLMQPKTFQIVQAGSLKKGDLISISEIAGVMAAKKTSDLIPLCHPLPLNKIQVELTLDAQLPGVVITATAATHGKTGVEMEALTAVSVAALTVYDMAKAVEKSMKIQNIRLLEKSGGVHGDYKAEA